jgi:hypothetical protein
MMTPACATSSLPASTCCTESWITDLISFAQVATDDLARGGGDRVGACAHVADNLLQVLIHAIERLQELTGLVRRLRTDTARQIAGCHRLCDMDRFMHARFISFPVRLHEFALPPCYADSGPTPHRDIELRGALIKMPPWSDRAGRPYICFLVGAVLTTALKIRIVPHRNFA